MSADRKNLWGTSGAVVAVGVAALAWLAGCTVGPEHSVPEMKGPEHFRGAGGGITSRPVEGGAAPGSLGAWWESMADPVLTSLVERALEGSLDRRVAIERVREARALRGVAAGAMSPEVAASASAVRSRGSQSVGSPVVDSDGTNLYRVGLDASWELDVFGGLRRGVQAADADLGAAVESERLVRVTLAAEVARTYCEYRGLQARAALARRTIESQRSTLDVAASRSKAGLWAEIEAEQARAQLATRESQLPPLLAAQQQASYRLAVLMGREPGALVEELAAEAEVPVPPSEVPVGLPADLLRRRPDIRRAERQLAAATARTGVATAELYPKFFLTGAAGLSSGEVASLPDSQSVAWSIGPTMRWKLFQGGRIRANIAAADARQRAAVLVFEQSWLTALEDVESTLTAFVQEQSRRERLTAAVEANRRAVDLADSRWKNGIGDFLTVLVNQRQLFDSEDQLVQSHTAVSTSLARLYKALGGGWADVEDQGAGEAGAAGGV
ncbi:MAG: efflux transporter outer membrane subunit [Phycisphaerales bacterium]|nr:efflux transporter outer membrane subunit [Phycisphaerales bacterium]